MISPEILWNSTKVFMLIITFSKLLQRHWVCNPFDRCRFKIMLWCIGNFLSKWVNKMAHYTCKNPIFPILMSPFNHMVSKLIWQASFDSYKAIGIMVHAKNCPVIWKFVLKMSEKNVLMTFIIIWKCTQCALGVFNLDQKVQSRNLFFQLLLCKTS